MIDPMLQQMTSDNIILQLRVSEDGEWTRDARLRSYLRDGWNVADAHELFPKDGFMYLTVRLERRNTSSY